MILLELFLTFLKIGAVSFGGGYGMISLIREECLSHGWLTEEDLLNLIAVAESTPGPIAVNMATFVGSSQAGLLGSFLATLGVVLPSFVIILIIAALINNLIRYRAVKAALGGIRPAVVGLIIATAVTMALNLLLHIKVIDDIQSAFLEWRGAVILAAVALISFLYKKIAKKKISPILLILISGALGVVFYI